MPSSTPKQAKFMKAVGHNPSFAKKVGVPQKVGQEFSKADKAKKFDGPAQIAKAHALRMKKPKSEPDADDVSDGY